MKFRVFIEQDDDGVFVAHCPSLRGCFSQGKTRIEAQANINEANEAMEGYLESLAKHGETENHPH
jgi:predicted RNase H-like HicB family nuclease